jgi:hypothetical protein
MNLQTGSQKALGTRFLTAKWRFFSEHTDWIKKLDGTRFLTAK